jgi:hypothetical protein
MKKSRYKEEQIIAVLKEVDARAKVHDVIRRLGISEETYYRWKAKTDARAPPGEGSHRSSKTLRGSARRNSAGPTRLAGAAQSPSALGALGDTLARWNGTYRAATLS